MKHFIQISDRKWVGKWLQTKSLESFFEIRVVANHKSPKDIATRAYDIFDYLFWKRERLVDQRSFQHMNSKPPVRSANKCR
jgi:hypothetical protein